MNNVLGLCCENTLLPLSPSSGEPAGLARCETRRPAGSPCLGVSLGIRGNSRQRCSRLLLRVIQQNCSFSTSLYTSRTVSTGVPPMGSVLMRRIRRFLCGGDRPRPVSLMDCRKAFQTPAPATSFEIAVQARHAPLHGGLRHRFPETEMLRKRPTAPGCRRCRSGARSGIERGATLMAAATHGMSSHAQCIRAFGVVPAMHEETSLRRRWPVKPGLSKRRCWQAREHEKGGRESRPPSRRACSTVTDSAATARAIVHLPAFAVRLP